MLAKDYWAQKRRERIAKLRETGLCIMCGKNPVETERSTCNDCGVKANERANKRKKPPTP